MEGERDGCVFMGIREGEARGVEGEDGRRVTERDEDRDPTGEDGEYGRRVGEIGGESTR